MAIEHVPVKPRLPAFLRVTGQVFEITITDYPMFGPDGKLSTGILVDGQRDDGPRRILVSKNQSLTDQARSLAYVVLRAELHDRGRGRLGYIEPDNETLCQMADIVGDLIEANICR